MSHTPSVKQDPILIIGGAGEVGRWATRFLRAHHPEVPLLIGGRDTLRSEHAAAAVPGASAVTIDLDAADLGLGRQNVSAIATLFTDATGAALRYAQQHGVGHVNISPSISEMGIEVASFMLHPGAAPVVLGTEWLVGATSVPTLLFAQAFAKLDSIAIEAVLDTEDVFGPAANADFERQLQTGSAALSRMDGKWHWSHGEQNRSTVQALDGTTLQAHRFAFNDVLLLANATGAPDVRFDLAIGVSSARRQGGAPGTEILIALSGRDHTGQALSTRHAIVHPGGQMPLTGLGVALVLERLAGLNGAIPKAGLYFPTQLIEHSTYIERLRAAGGEVLTV